MSSAVVDAVQSVGTRAAQIERLRDLSFRILPGMWEPGERLYAFRVKRQGDSLVREGVSRRYTAIVLIGLVDEDPGGIAPLMGGCTVREVGERLCRDAAMRENLGDAALAAWAARLYDLPSADSALDRVRVLLEAEGTPYTVELSWALMALSLAGDRGDLRTLRDRTAARLLAAFNPNSGCFTHAVGGNGGGWRRHVCCFADLVYPVQSLSACHEAGGADGCLDAARAAAARFCALQGPAGQWWWHYDVRTGDVVEAYPVYSVHQEAMGPMALLALDRAAGTNHDEFIARGLDWLDRAPELDGASIIDERLPIIWRKVGRREPAKLSRRVQAAASWVHSGLRVPWTDAMFPANAIDYECRPYELGWLLHAFPRHRCERSTG